MMNNKIPNYNDTISAKLFTLKELLDSSNEIRLRIPLYQRLYVWEIAEIEMFVEDIADAFNNKEQNYFIGNMVFSEDIENDIHNIDLIDGQQRFTTLWFISLLLKDYSKNLRSFAYIDNSPRLSFTSRDSVNQYFEYLKKVKVDFLDDKRPRLSYSHYSKKENDINKENSIDRITKSIYTLYNVIHSKIVNNKWGDKEIIHFTEFIFNNLIMGQTTVPQSSNLNQIFESLNSGGKQLENHQILKARFLKVLRERGESNIDSEVIKRLVAKWDACSNMNQYLERNVYNQAISSTWIEIIKDSFFNNDNNSNNEESKDAKTASEFFNWNKYNVEEDNISEGINLIGILDNDHHNENSTFISDSKLKDDDNNKVRSLISFPQFLLHSLRVYNLKKGMDDISHIDQKKLLGYFDIKDKGHFSNPDNVKEFIEIVFELRFLFDKFVVKWSDIDGQERLAINKLYCNKYNKNISVARVDKEDNKELELAQSVLYFVQESKTQYWITPFLYYLHTTYLEKYNNNKNIEYVLAIKLATERVEQIDKFFYCQEQCDNMLELSRNVCKQNDSEKNGHYGYVEQELKANAGTGFIRYWFYKTEYLIWKMRKNFIVGFTKEKEKELWKEFRIVQKNSIEHIHPQNPKDPIDEFEKLHSFGNLVLITPSENSEYSNLNVHEKRDRFVSKINNNHIDSLKSSLIFNLVNQSLGDKGKEGVWSIEKCEKHLQEVLILFTSHVN